MGNENLNNKPQFNQQKDDQQGAMKKTGVGQQPAQPQKEIGKQGNTPAQPSSNPSVRNK